MKKRPIASPEKWTGAEVVRLRRAGLRMDVEEFADHLGVPPEQVRAWENTRRTITIGWVLLDAALQEADTAGQIRFERSMRTGDLQEWTGLEVRLLREASGKEQREFADYLGIPHALMSFWERQAELITPEPHMQAILDVALALTDRPTQIHFQRSVREASSGSVRVSNDQLKWTGVEIFWLRVALRLDTKDFAAELGVPLGTVQTWEKRGESITPHPGSQKALNAMRTRAAPDAQARFQRSVNMGSLQDWTGADACRLIDALGLESLQAAAHHLGISKATVWQWKSLGVSITPGLKAKALLDRALAQTDPSIREHFWRRDGKQSKTGKQLQWTGTDIRLLRLALNKSKTEFATSAGLKRKTLQYWENVARASTFLFGRTQL